MNEIIIKTIEQSKDLPQDKLLPLYKEMPSDVDEFVKACDELMGTRQWRPFWLVTMWIKRKQDAFDLKFFPDYQRWLYEYIDSWGACDVFCYRILNPMVEKFPPLFENVLEWTQSEKVYVRRASAVCLIHPIRYSFCVNAEFEKVQTICDGLKSDGHIHVQKAVGWLLKYAYLSYPEQVDVYLRENISNLSRTTLRYALEKMEPSLKTELMAL